MRRHKTALADDMDAGLIYRLRRDLEDLKPRMVETIRVITLDDSGIRTELALTGLVGDVTVRPARLTAAERQARREQQLAQYGSPYMFVEGPDGEPIVNPEFDMPAAAPTER